MKRVAIVGFAPSWVDTPFTDPSFDIWAMNYHHRDARMTRVDRIFELHAWDLLLKEDGGQHVPSLAAVTCPVYMQEVRPEVPTSVKYPLDMMKEKYAVPNSDVPYFTNTASFMIALAIEEGYEEIWTFGLDMAHNTEYGQQRPSCEFFLGIAMGKGIKIVPHRTSDLLKTAFVYGYDDHKRDWFAEKLQARRAFLLENYNTHTRTIEQAKQAQAEFSGALQDLDHIRQVWT